MPYTSYTSESSLLSFYVWISIIAAYCFQTETFDEEGTGYWRYGQFCTCKAKRGKERENAQLRAEPSYYPATTTKKTVTIIQHKIVKGFKS